MARMRQGVVMTIRLLGRTEIRNLAKELEFRPRKSLGQNFVHDASFLPRASINTITSSRSVQAWGR